ncbi:RNA polymerase sigma factor [Candidatus Contubernalis alkaliaceticus]|uniref:RNA polymerase sigma factor n=1 Tax=Candidatus Contubernalis alkaliaceticus TaxID=338645 RepID=UPI001F4C10BD|nr:RNA polymerase sigma factor [Candidatus Contubernalis alkalaceticus]UNC93046.1 RNA polymerase sigma factor [Candidatus Contubernalis alkalaceticus]
MKSEDNLIKAALAKDQEAFREIVDIYQAFVFAIILNIIRDYQEAENIAQETFIQVYRSLPQYQFKGFKTWIGRIATNKAIDFKRKRMKEKEGQLSLSDQLLNQDLSKQDLLEDRIIRKEELENMERLINRLPEKYHNVMIKHFIQAKSYQKIADEEGVSIRTVGSRLYRAKKLMRQYREEGG